jgi:hypothetical protein
LAAVDYREISISTMRRLRFFLKRVSFIVPRLHSFQQSPASYSQADERQSPTVPFIGINVTATGRDAGIDAARYKAEMFSISFLRHFVRITFDCVHQTRQV